MTAIARIGTARSVAVETSPPEPEILWEGRPAWASAAIHIWKVRPVALYFAVLLADGARLAFAGPAASPDAGGGELKLLIVSLVVLGFLCLLAWLTRRTTRYTIDDRQVTLRYGIALQATLVIPFGAIEHVGVRVRRDGTGDIALRLKPGRRVIYPKLWPHARPWRFLRAEPMLRSVAEAGVAASVLCRAIAAAKDADAAWRALRAEASLPFAAE